MEDNVRALLQLISQSLGERRPAWLARQCGLTESAVSQWFTGDTIPSARALARIAVIFDLDGRHLARLAGRDPEKVAQLQDEMSGPIGLSATALVEFARAHIDQVYLIRIRGNPQSTAVMAEQIAMLAGQPVHGSREVIQELLRLRGRALFEWATALREIRQPNELVRATAPVVDQMKETLADLSDGHARDELAGLISVTEGQAAYIARHPDVSLAHLIRVGEEVNDDERLLNRRTIAINWAELGRDGQVDRERARSTVRRLEIEALHIIGLGAFGNEHTVVVTLEGFGRARGLLGMEKAVETLEAAKRLAQQIRSRGAHYPLPSIQIARSRLRVMLTEQERDHTLFEQIATEGLRSAQAEGYERYADQFVELLREFNDAPSGGPTGRGRRAQTTGARYRHRVLH